MKKDETFELEDSRLYRVELVVALPNYSVGDNSTEPTAIDAILQMICGDPELLVLNANETKLQLKEVQ